MIELITALNLEGTFNSSMQKELIGFYLVHHAHASLMSAGQGEIRTEKRSRSAKGSFKNSLRIFYAGHPAQLHLLILYPG